MPVTIIIGAQWGDEGKGRFVDNSATDARFVARFSGGDNAGHTVAVGDTVYKMHLIPSGILHDGVIALLGNGMVINPISLRKEVNRLREQGVSITPENLVISSRAHLVTPAHIELDRFKESARGDDAIGTTLRGIGPAYLDKVGRRGLRVGQILDIETFAEEFEASVASHNETLVAAGVTPVDLDAVRDEYMSAINDMRPYIKDTTLLLNKALQEGAKVVAEGAQGTLLDVDHGSYPFVTSSSPTSGGVLTGLGIGPTYVKDVVGVAKSFSTRVGSGPMPTELKGEVAAKLRGTGDNFWDEFGTTTGRERRCGWLDAVLLRYSMMVNGFTKIMLTKLDILSGLDELKIAVAYEVDGERLDLPPTTITQLQRAKPIYETLSGWQEDIMDARTLDDLPQAAIDYIKRIEELCGVPIEVVSVGPHRKQVVQL
ncbi:MAG: adenylosuccinate synthase [Chloroflexota bacterium]